MQAKDTLSARMAVRNTRASCCLGPNESRVGLCGGADQVLWSFQGQRDHRNFATL